MAWPGEGSRGLMAAVENDCILHTVNGTFEVGSIE